MQKNEQISRWHDEVATLQLYVFIRKVLARPSVERKWCQGEHMIQGEIHYEKVILEGMKANTWEIQQAFLGLIANQVNIVIFLLICLGPDMKWKTVEYS